MNYKHKFNGILYDTEQQVKDTAIATHYGKRVRVQKLYPKIKDNPEHLTVVEETATEEEIEAMNIQNEQITLNNIEYTIKEYE
jgi:hypothetical protein